MPAVHFVTFGNLPKYVPVLKRIKEEAERSGYFDSVKLYIPQIVPGFDAHSSFVSTNKRGYGYWIWKPLVILDRLGSVPEGDIVIYTDAGCTINSTPNARSLFKTYMENVQSHPSHRMACQTSHIEEMWTKADLLEKFGFRNGPHAKSGQFMGGIIIVVNTAENRAFLREWYDTMVADGYHYVTDAPSRIPNSPIFKEHRHDMSILSLLMKRDGAFNPDHPGCSGTDSPFTATRLRPN